MQNIQYYDRIGKFSLDGDYKRAEGYRIINIASFDGYLIVVYEKPEEPVEDSGTMIEPETVGNFKGRVRYENDAHIGKPPDKRDPDPDTKEDYLLKMDREAREEKRKRLGEFADKPRLQVGMLGEFPSLEMKYIGILNSVEIKRGEQIYKDENSVPWHGFRPFTHAEIMEFAAKAPKE